jgi:hypothetical protein
MAPAAEELAKIVYNLVSRKKTDDDGFMYVCGDYECQGRKGIVTHLKEKYEDKYNEMRGDKAEAEFDSALSKLVMKAPLLEDKPEEVEAPAKPAKTATKPIETAKKTEEKTEVVQEELKLTLGTMKVIDARTTKLPNYGSLCGRIARLLAMVITKEEDEEGNVTLKDKHLEGHPTIPGFSDVYEHLQKEHEEFVEHLLTMFPPAKKRLNQFVERAVQNFEMKIPSEKEVKEALRAEAEKKRAQRLKELKEQREKEEKIKEEKRLAVKRKIEEQKEKSKKLAEEMAKKAKIEADKPASPEEMARRKKEIERIKSNLKEGMTGVRRSRLEKRLEELEAKVNKDEKGAQEEQIKKRIESIMEILSPKQLRKLCMIYFENIDDLASLSWKETAETIKMEDELEFLMDFCSLLFDMAKLYDEKSFKIGHILVTSKQAEALVEKGIWSYRDFIKDDSWRIPSSWDVDIPSEDLGEDWNRKDDSRLLIGASRFGKNLAKIMNLYPNMKTKALDDKGKVKGCVKSRFAYLLNVYQNRGKYVEELGLNLYNVDVEEEENCVKESKPDVIEIEDEENGEEKNGTTEKDDDEVSDSILDTKDGEDEAMEDEEEVDEEALLADDS